MRIQFVVTLEVRTSDNIEVSKTLAKRVIENALDREFRHSALFKLPEVSVSVLEPHDIPQSWFEDKQS